MDDLTLVVHYYIIKVYDKRGGNGELVEVLKWDNLPFKVRIKYEWYFKYRAALLQVKYPKYLVDVYWGNEPAKGVQLKRLIKAKIKSKIAKITDSKNKRNGYIKEFDNYKKQYLKLFEIENENQYKVFENSIDLAKIKIQKLEKELDILLSKVN
jgi:hypothetical protein